MTTLPSQNSEILSKKVLQTVWCQNPYLYSGRTAGKSHTGLALPVNPNTPPSVMVADVRPMPLPNPTSVRGRHREARGGGGDCKKPPCDWSWPCMFRWYKPCPPPAMGSVVNEGTALGLHCLEHRQGGGIRLLAVSFSWPWFYYPDSPLWQYRGAYLDDRSAGSTVGSGCLRLFSCHVRQNSSCGQAQEAKIRGSRYVLEKSLPFCKTSFFPTYTPP